MNYGKFKKYIEEAVFFAIWTTIVTGVEAFTQLPEVKDDSVKAWIEIMLEEAGLVEDI